MTSEYTSAVSDKLSKAGFSQKESIIYGYLLEREGAFPSIVAKDTGLNRTTVYKILTALSVKGLVTEYERRKKYFYQAADPKRLEKYAQTQIAMAETAKENLESIMPLLSGLYKGSPNKPIVRYFEGKENILAIYDDHVESKESYEMLAFSNTVGLLPILSQKFKEDYVKRKTAIGITTRAIVPSSSEDTSSIENFYKAFPKKVMPEIKYLPPETFPFNADLTLYAGNRVSILNFNEPHFFGTIIEDKTIYNMIKTFFELVWDNFPKNKDVPIQL